MTLKFKPGDYSQTESHKLRSCGGSVFSGKIRLFTLPRTHTHGHMCVPEKKVVIPWVKVTDLGNLTTKESHK